MKKPPTRPKGGKLPLAEMDPEAFAKAPLTRSFLLDTSYEGTDDERQTGYIVLRAQETRWTMTLKDPSSCLQFFVGAPTLKDLWKLVETVLGDPSTPWATDEYAKQRAPRARRKGG